MITVRLDSRASAYTQPVFRTGNGPSNVSLNNTNEILQQTLHRLTKLGLKQSKGMKNHVSLCEW